MIWPNTARPCPLVTDREVRDHGNDERERGDDEAQRDAGGDLAPITRIRCGTSVDVISAVVATTRS